MPGALEQHPDQPLRDLEVGDRAAAQRADGDDVAGRATDHLPGVVPEREHVLGAGVHRDDGRLVEDDAATARVDERVGGAEVDGEVARQGVLLLDRAERRDRSHGTGGPAPVGAVLPVLTLPDRDRLLQGVDAEPRGLECLRRGAATTPRPPPTLPTARGRRCGAAARSVRPRASGAAPRRRPAARRGTASFLVGLVGDAAHVVAAFGVVAHDAEEDDDRARRRWWPTRWQRRPAGRRRSRRSNRRMRAEARASS